MSEERLLELGFLAPQWLRHIENFLGWPGLREAVYWFLNLHVYCRQGANAAYVEGYTEIVVQKRRAAIHISSLPDVDSNPWIRLLRERSQFADTSVVDREWFRKVHGELGEERWAKLHEAAKFGGPTAEVKKSIRLSDALRGQLDRQELIDLIREHMRHEDLPLLSLLPLPKGAARKEDLVERCLVLDEFARHANKLGKRGTDARVDAENAINFAFKYLAETAEVADPQRLQWIVASKLEERLRNTSPCQVGDMMVTLTLDDVAEPRFEVLSAGKKRKTIPKAIKSDDCVQALVQFGDELKEFGRKARKSFENSMVRGDVYTGEELRQLFDNAVLGPLISNLVFVIVERDTPQSTDNLIAGYPVDRAALSR